MLLNLEEMLRFGILSFGLAFSRLWRVFSENYPAYTITPDSECLAQPLSLPQFNTFFAHSGAQLINGKYTMPRYSVEQMLALCHLMMLSGFKTVGEQTQADAFTDKRCTAFFNAIRKVPSTFKNMKPLLNIAERVYNNYPIRLFLMREHLGTSTIRAAGATLSLLHGSGVTMFMEIYGFLKASSTAASIHPKVIEEAALFFEKFDAIKLACNALGVEWQYYKVFHPDGLLSASAAYPNLAFCVITIRKQAKDSSWKNYQTNAKGDKNVDYSVLGRPIKSMKGKVAVSEAQQEVLLRMGVPVVEGHVDYDNYEEKSDMRM